MVDLLRDHVLDAATSQTGPALAVAVRVVGADAGGSAPRTTASLAGETEPPLGAEPPRTYLFTFGAAQGLPALERHAERGMAVRFTFRFGQHGLGEDVGRHFVAALGDAHRNGFGHRLVHLGLARFAALQQSEA
ncbi:hypothetical protein [Streptomyces atratus]|uniref:hypothetical protein n=1 Tax=Streptomyces atratus TaxID=1893 RepID=UPI00379CB0B1